MIELLVFQFAVLCYLLWRVDICYIDREKANARADLWEAKCHSLSQQLGQKAGPSSFEQGVAAAKKIATCTQDDRLFVEGRCNGHRFLVRFRSDTAADAMLAIQRWFDINELGLCRECVEKMQGGVLREAGIHE